ncbi:DUF692 domain-containing protein [Streptomyces alboniger]|uniref:DUF692 domain-containing protein n=2 Tax=Streptomyces TaxID=1883 RepID=A0A5J6HNV4_STRAD|nr:DUF692 domain-containing protein [Streptomyces alboniger]QEV20892.1 DUF692 domain-containing protein [Streptomyces alboniger]
MRRLGTGIGWRPEIADAVEAMPGIDWVEAVAENVCPGHLPDSLLRLRERGVTVVPHGVSLGLGGADRPDEGRLTALAERALALGSPLVTEHIAFVRAGGDLTATQLLEAGHLLPVPRTRDALAVLCENVRIAQDALPVPLAVENIAALISWPGEEMTEGQFLYELVERTGVRLLIDVANLHTNHVNRGEDPAKALDELPVEAIAYVHVAGGFERDGVWHDSHAHPVPEPVLAILTDLASRTTPPGVLLERDDNFPEPAELERELATIRATVETTGKLAGDLGTKAGGGLPKGAGGGLPGGSHEGLPGGRRGELPDEQHGELLGGRRGELPDGQRGSLPGGPREDHLSGAAPGGNPSSPRTPRTPREGFSDVPHEASLTAPHQDLPDAPREDLPAPPGDLPAPAEARQRSALAQAALLSALVAGTPAPEGFDRARLKVQSHALAAKRADVVAKVAPELPDILGGAYRADFLAYAHARPMTGGYRLDALRFAEHLLLAGRLEGTDAGRRLSDWWLERSGPAPLSRRPAARLLKATRRILSGR